MAYQSRMKILLILSFSAALALALANYSMSAQYPINQFNLNFTQIFKQFGEWISSLIGNSVPTLIQTSTSTAAPTTTAFTGIQSTTTFLTTPPSTTQTTVPQHVGHGSTCISGCTQSASNGTISTSTIPSLPPFTTTVFSTSTSTSITSTTTVAQTLAVSLSNKYPQSQLIDFGASVYIAGNVSGGAPPYHYQWLGAVKNTSSSYSASMGNQFCGTTSQSLTCNFQTVTNNSALSPGAYYLKLQVTDSSSQSANTPIAYVTVFLVGQA